MSAVQKAIRDFEVKLKENETQPAKNVKRAIEKFEKKNVQNSSGPSIVRPSYKSLPTVVEKSVVEKSSTTTVNVYEEEIQEDYCSSTCQILEVSPKVKTFPDVIAFHEEKAVMSSSNKKNMEDTPTVKPIEPFDAVKDATDLKEAMAGLGCNNKVITRIIGNRSFDQRLQIEVTYRELFNQHLVEDLKSELGGVFEDLVKGLMLPRNQYIASLLNKAMKGMGTDEDSLIYLLFSVGNAQKTEIGWDYKRIYGNDLENDIVDEISGDFKELVLATLQANRYENAPVDNEKAHETVNQIFDTGDGNGLDKDNLINALVLNSYDQLLEINSACENITEKSLEELCESQMSEEFMVALKTILAVAKNEHAFWANKLHYAMAGVGTDDNTLISIIVLRSEIDLGSIANEYERMYEKSLKDAIAEDCSGDYKNLLLEILKTTN